MKYKDIKNTNLKLPVLGLGTWVFGSDVWWGHQDDRKSLEVLEYALGKSINFIDTAPVYGRGHAEELIGRFLNQHNRDNLIIATKLGLSWNRSRIYHDLSHDKMLKEIDLSLKRLNTDYIDIYQIHWPNPDTSVKETATVMGRLYEEGKIKAIGVSNYDIALMKEFMQYAPLHSLQPPYNMFNRKIEDEIVEFCIKNNISIIVYSPLDKGVLTGKFFFKDMAIPKDKARQDNPNLKEPLYSINKDILMKLSSIADKYEVSLTELVLSWTLNQKGITSVLIGARNLNQIKQNINSINLNLDKKDKNLINEFLDKRELLIKNLK